MSDEIVVKVGKEEIRYTAEDIPQRLARRVLGYQDACNLSGVVRCFLTEILHELWEYAHANNKGTDWVNHHPLVFLTVDKFVQLSKYQTQNENGIRIYELIEKAAEGEK